MKSEHMLFFNFQNIDCLLFIGMQIEKELAWWTVISSRLICVYALFFAKAVMSLPIKKDGVEKLDYTNHVLIEMLGEVMF